MRDQDRPTEDQARGDAPSRSGPSTEVVEAGADAAHNADDRQHQVGRFRDTEEVPGDSSIERRQDDGEQDLDRAWVL